MPALTPLANYLKSLLFQLEGQFWQRLIHLFLQLLIGITDLVPLNEPATVRGRTCQYPGEVAVADAIAYFRGSPTFPDIPYLQALFAVLYEVCQKA